MSKREHNAHNQVILLIIKNALMPLTSDSESLTHLTARGEI